MGAQASTSENENLWQEYAARLGAWFDIVLSLLAILMLALILAELTLTLPEPWTSYVIEGQVAIWAIFVAAFAFELALASSKTRYLRENWLVALSLAVPALRVFRVARALRVLRGTNAVRGLGTARVAAAFRRSARVVGDFARASQFAYLLGLAVLVTFSAAGLVFFLERGQPDATIDSPGAALWWAASLITTVSAPLEPVTWEGRFIGILLRIFGVAVIGYLTARIAVFLLARGPGEREEPTDVNDQVRRLEGEIDRLARLLEDQQRRQRP